MRMLPPRIYQGTASRAERRLFPMFADLRGWEGATCLHSVGLPEHERHSSEIDFLIVAPKGILVLEVKGGHISCQDGVWSWDGRSGQRTNDVRSPFVQAMQASSALSKKLAELLGHSFIKEVAVGHGVIFPDVARFNLSSVETPGASAITIDANRLHGASGLGGVLEGLYRHWHIEYPGKRMLSPSEVKSLVGAVRPDFEFAESLAVQGDAVIQQLDAFTQEQYDRLDVLSYLDRAIVTGGAGTGKTFIATEVARRFASAGNSVLFITYSASLASFLSQRLAGVANLKVQSFNDHLTSRSPGWRRLPGYSAELDANDPWFRTTLMRAALASPSPTEADVLIVDEGQDFLTMDCLDVLSTAVRGGLEEGTWRFFHDASRQASPFIGADLEALPYLESLVDNVRTLATLTLTKNCRNSKSVVEFVDSTCGTDIGAPCETDQPPPPIFREECSSPEEFVSMLTSHLVRLHGRGVPLTDITIVSPRKFAMSSASRLSPAWRNRITECGPGARWHVPLPPLTFVSIDDIRGLENRHVIVTDLEGIDADPVERSRFYIAITRARMSLTILATPEASLRINKLQQNHRVGVDDGA